MTQQDLTEADKRLHRAAQSGDVEAMHAALQAGADMEAAQSNHSTALIYAVKNGHVAATRWLLKQGANPHVMVHPDNTPLMIAAWDEDAELVDALLDAGANPNWPPASNDLTGFRGFYPLHRVSVTGEVDIAKKLIRAGADMDARVKRGGAPLWFAVANNSIEVASALLASGANPDACYENNTQVLGTPSRNKLVREYALHKVCDTGQESVMRLLLDAGADIDAKDAKGRTALQVLKEATGNKTKLIAVLEEYEHYPAFSEDKLDSLRKADIFAPNAEGYCLLDSPSTWQHFTAIAEHLEQAGEPFTAAELEAINKDGKSWLQRGVECFAGKDVLVAYGRAGGDIGAQMLDARKQSSTLMELLCRRQQIGQAMTEEVWRDAPQAKESVKAICAALPYAHRNDVPNQHQLLAKLGQQAAASGRGR